MLGWAVVSLPGSLVWLANGQMLWSDAPWVPPGGWCPSELAWRPSGRHVSAAAMLALVGWWAFSLQSQLLAFAAAGVVAQRQGGSQGAAAAAGAEGLAETVQHSGRSSNGGVRDAGQALRPALGSLALAALPLASLIIHSCQALAG